MLYFSYQKFDSWRDSERKGKKMQEVDKHECSGCLYLAYSPNMKPECNGTKIYSNCGCSEKKYPAMDFLSEYIEDSRKWLNNSLKEERNV